MLAGGAASTHEMHHPARLPRPDSLRPKPSVSAISRAVCCAVAIATLTRTGVSPARAELPDDHTLRRWVADMKDAPRGPFAQLRWFCRDGTVAPAVQGCGPHGEGIQHGEWTDRVIAMREGGYRIANVLADLDGTAFTGPTADAFGLEQILVERFLVAADDGWILRAGYTYRGALQAEDEEAGARRILAAMLEDPRWRTDERFFLLREAVRLLPHQRESQDPVAAMEIRQLAKVIAERDPRFEPLRAKIHGMPDPGDAERVRAYARTRGSRNLGATYDDLAREVERLYEPGAAADAVVMLARRTSVPEVAAELRKQADLLEVARDPVRRLALTSFLSGLLRYQARRWTDADAGLAFFEASLALESEAYGAGNALLAELHRTSRRQRLDVLGYLANNLYGTGLITKRHRDDLQRSLKRIAGAGDPSLDTYRRELRYLARAPEWAGRTVEFHFSPAVAHFARIEPQARLYPQDRLRGSPLLLYGAVIDSLVRDGDRLTGIEQILFGERVGTGLRALNPGLARGILRSLSEAEETADFDPEGIYLLPETTADLRPVAGILTRGEGSSLSHVQLLARNLGIPNVVVGDRLLPAVEARDGKRVVLAVSPGGVVRLEEDGSRWDGVLGTTTPSYLRIEPDVDKLDLEATDFVPLSQLRAKDSGRLAGPKSANLGELRHRFGDAVPDGFVIPFGAFRQLLERPLEPGGPSVFAWMKERYRALAARGGSRETERRALREFLGRLRAWIETVDLGPDFRARLARALEERFGRDGTFGVFVRSDTNVEDLPGFTGAGLNLTVPNVVGFENIVDAIRRVWASPFTERAYAWRQAHMENPEYVFPAVLVQRAFASEKSGVMVTADVERGDPAWLSIAVNEGVGGAVEGQAAESLLVNATTRETRFLAQGTAPTKRLLAASGGLRSAPATGTEAILDDVEIAELVNLAAELPRSFPAVLRGEDGKAVPADVEFAFARGRLALLQIRPFVDSASARRSRYLRELDAAPEARGSERVPLDAVP
jgi:phosphohistidine swiveling domain-containing protein